MDTVHLDLGWLPFAVTVILGIAALAWSVYTRALPRPIPGIPYDKDAAKSILGSLPQIISYKNQHGVVLPWLTGQNDKLGAPLVQFFGLPFTKPTLILSDFQESQDVLLRRTKEFDRASTTIIQLSSVTPDAHIAMRSDDPRFKGNRELMRDLMSPHFLNSVSATEIYSKTMALVELWTRKAKVAGARSFDARQDIFDAAMDIVNAAAFAFDENFSLIKRQLDRFGSHDTAAFAEKPDGSVEFPRPDPIHEIDILQRVVSFLGSQITSQFPTLTYWYRILTDSGLRRDIALKDELIKGQIRDSLERLKKGDTTQRSATDYLLQRENSVARKEQREPNYFSRRTIDELFVYVTGGHETTSATLTWSLKLLSDHQHVQAKLYEVLMAAFPQATAQSRSPTAKEIAESSIPYLDAVLEECMRIGAPTPLSARETVVDTVLLGHWVPKGVFILINSAGPSYYSKALQIEDSKRSETSRTKHRGGMWNPDDAHLFDPERWLKIDNEGKTIFDAQAGPFMSFSLGPRGCFGRRLAYLELRLVTTLLLWNFRFCKLEGALASYDAVEAATVSAKHCYISLEPRSG